MHEKQKLQLITATALLAAMITIMTAYICHIPVGINGGYIHFGDALIYIGAALLPQPYALIAAAIGGGMADLLTAPMWVPATLIIKIMITLPFSSKDSRIITCRNIIASAAAFLITGFGYYIAAILLFGKGSALLVSLSQSAIQSLGSMVLFLVLGTMLDRIHFKNRMFPLSIKDKNNTVKKQ
jgi:uncharacterized repeat protein (TIGR04002 family)